VPCILIPVKEPTRAKTRLAGLLSAAERARLVWAMFEDVAAAVNGVTRADRVVLVSSYAPALEFARASGWEVLIEEQQSSESASIDWASAILSAAGHTAVLRLPADVPMIRATDLDELLGVELRAPAVLLVPSRDGTGTNAIIRTPPGLFASRFGPNSLALHREEAARAGAGVIIRDNPRIALDVDDPADLERVLEVGQGTRTYEVVTGFGGQELLRRNARS